MLTERIESPSILEPGEKYFTVMQYTYREGHTEVVSMALEETKHTEQGYESERLEMAINVKHGKQKEANTVYFAHNLNNSHVFDEFKQREDTQVS